jgi:hydrogenase maturation protein HypF
MRLESAIHTETDKHYPFKLDKNVIFAETFRSILDDMPNSDISLISSKFHNTVAQVILEVSQKIRKDASINKVVLSGGVFQNKYLLEKSTQKLTENRFNVFINHQVPANDGGISLGQLVIASKIFGLCV